MSEYLTMPKVGHVMEEGTMVRWLKNVGDRVDKGDAIFEIEMDKSNFEVESFQTGTLKQILVEAGDIVKVGAPVGVLE